MLEWHEWTGTGDPPPESERLLFAERIRGTAKLYWVVGTAEYVEDLDLSSADLRLSRCPGDTWKGTMYWARLNLSTLTKEADLS